MYCSCVQGSGADLLEHLQDGAQALKVGGATGTNGKLPHNVDTALTHVDGRITEITRQLGDYMASVQQLKSESQTRAAATEDAISKLQHAVKEIQARLLMTSAATSCPNAKYREILERNFPIDALVSQIFAENILVQLEYDEIQCTRNQVEKNRKFFDYLFRKNNTALARTLNILNQPQNQSYHYLGDILINVFCRQMPHIQSLS